MCRCSRSSQKEARNRNQIGNEMKTIAKIILAAIITLFISGCADKYKGLKKSPCACLEQEISNV